MQLLLYIFFLICSASVTAVFVIDEDEGKEASFQRSVQGSSSEYRINGSVSDLKFVCFCVFSEHFCERKSLVFKWTHRLLF